MIEIVEKKDCVGCKACGDICLVGAISFYCDEEGFWYPAIDKNICVNCGACDRVCPALAVKSTSAERRAEPEIYKVYHKDESIRYNSTSGGLYSLIAQPFLDRGGYIAGCVYSDDYSTAYHVISNKQEDLLKIRRSKYFQSDTEKIFAKVRKLLKQGEEVLFCGSPCQVGALYGFLGKDYERLYTTDYICRGINSPLAYTAYMKELKDKFNSDIEEVHFKNKSHGWTNLGTLVRFKNGKTYYRNRYNDPWVNGFITANLYMRPSCENCKYRGFPRVADISMGDFWGLNFTKEEKKLGVSLAIVTTTKGNKMLDNAKEHSVVERHEFKELFSSNGALRYSPKFNSKRKEFFARIQAEPYSEVVWSILGTTPLKQNIKYARVVLINSLKSILRS